MLKNWVVIEQEIEPMDVLIDNLIKKSRVESSISIRKLVTELNRRGNKISKTDAAKRIKYKLGYSFRKICPTNERLLSEGSVTMIRLFLKFFLDVYY